MLGKRHIVVTGIGLISPVGIGTEPTWQALLRGESGIAPITLFDAGGNPRHSPVRSKDLFLKTSLIARMSRKEHTISQLDS